MSLAQPGGEPRHVVLPVEYGAGRDLAGQAGWFVICEALPGPALGVGPASWREGELIACVLQPAAAALAALQERGLTHRAINPDNLFRAGPRERVMLGPFWAAPAGSLQPAVFEPPYSARCLPNGRGDGTIADDVYALGVTLLALAIGRMPLAQLDEAALLARKMEVGSYAALTADAALTPLLSDLLRGMLAEDPEHRPSPHLLMKPEQARARRVAARPPRRAQVALNIGGTDVWSARELAHVLGLRWEHGFRLLKSGEVERWLRRHLGDPPLGMRVEDVTRQPEDNVKDEGRRQNLLVMRAVAAIDGLAPLLWRGLAVQPDGLGTALVGAGRDVATAIEEIIETEAVAAFLTVHERRHGLLMLIEEQRELRVWMDTRGPAGGVLRVLYGCNPMLVCASPLLGGRPVVRLGELLPALDQAAAAADRSRPPLDAHIAAFIAARADVGPSMEMRRVSSFAGAAERLVLLRVFGQIQARTAAGKLPGLAGWLAACGFATADDWHSHRTKAALQESVARVVAAGDLAGLALLMGDEAGREADRAQAAAVAEQIRLMAAEVAAIARAAPARAETSERVTYEVMTGMGLMLCLGAVLGLALL
jgi:hypothetical protein